MKYFAHVLFNKGYMKGAIASEEHLFMWIGQNENTEEHHTTNVLPIAGLTCESSSLVLWSSCVQAEEILISFRC